MVHLQPNTKTKKESFSPDERKAYAIFCQVRGKTIYNERIKSICNYGSIADFRELIEELKEASKDNPFLMLSTLGLDGYKVLNNL